MLKQISSFIFIGLLMAISTSAQIIWPPVLDVDGQPVVGGVEYYIVPTTTDTAGGLTLIRRNDSCPFYVGQETRGSGRPNGYPVTFTLRVAADDNIVRESRDFTAEFTSVVTTCIQSTKWKVDEEDPETGTTYIVTGKEPEYLNNYFNIGKDETGQYTIAWCPNCLTGVCPKPRCVNIGIKVENGERFLVLDDEAAFPFAFERVVSSSSSY